VAAPAAVASSALMVTPSLSPQNGAKRLLFWATAAPVGPWPALRAVRKSVSAPELIQTLSFRPWSPAIFQAADNSRALATRFSARRSLSRSRAPATKHLCRCFPAPRRAHAPPRPPPNPACRASVVSAGDCPDHPRRRQLQRLHAREHDHPRCVLRRAALCCSLIAAGMMN
jgi:hypothetical protein